MARRCDLWKCDAGLNYRPVLVDLDLLDPSWGPPLVMRIANTHLESLPQGTPVRPGQLALISRLLKQPDVDGGVVGGDMNAIAPSDARIHLDAGLLDAYTGHPNDHNGFTWGYQPLSEYPPARLDKLFYTPEVFGDPPPFVRVHPPELVGETLITSRGQWASDHYGLRTCVHFTQVA
ncbi:hypothetical protein SCP_1301880 [Sparassis crispa]|uniref:Endonuclease/exonuclease/phosphatase domain-containing protein n=1 Tax=Sparassis crispa TaxID=139825 RepID=A0A401H1V5_9APHY|nr:hypothetical protein SCP_1301880 [Sparassis crispa]GBE88373.1 hypothetical protein SCP_1301880 [Sparassis crispa]